MSSPGSAAPSGELKEEGRDDTKGVNLPPIVEDSRHSYDPLLQINFSAIIDLGCRRKDADITKAEELEQ